MTPVSSVPPSCQEALFMTSSPPSKLPVTVGELLRRRLREMKRSPEELAQAVEVPTEYIEDRKSTRLNSSHLVISYAVFCLKKKKEKSTMLDIHIRIAT